MLNPEPPLSHRSTANGTSPSPAYNALIKKTSYTGKATLFGQTCGAHYAPLTDAGGELTGAIFVANCDK
jgi:cache 3/cache 2 fusion protein